VVRSDVCIRADEKCGASANNSQIGCCDGLKCLMVNFLPYCLPCYEPGHESSRCDSCKPPIYNCLDCINETNGLCGGPNNIKCCPMYGCAHINNNPGSFGHCLPKPWISLWSSKQDLVPNCDRHCWKSYPAIILWKL